MERWARHPVYGPPVRKFAESMMKGGRAGYTPEQLGEAIWTALSAPRPALRYAPGPESPLTRLAVRLMPTRMFDQVMTRQLGLTRL